MPSGQELAASAVKYGLIFVGGSLLVPPLVGRIKRKIVLKNNQGMVVEVSKLGAALTKIIVPDRHGKKADVVLYPAKPQDNGYYMGVVIGRVANRISDAHFKNPDGQDVHLTANDNGKHALHGGVHGFQTKRFSAEAVAGPGYKAAVLKYTSPAGEEGYPGELQLTVTYRLAADKNELSCEISAVPVGEPTPVNVVQHTYWNMAGHNSGKDILDHQVHMPSSDHYTPVGSDLIPTGEILPVQGTPFDFTRPHTIGERIQECGPGGYDLNFVNHKMGPQARFICKGGGLDRPKLVATVQHQDTGRCLDVYTTAPGMQFYVGGQMEKMAGKNKATYGKHSGFCLETQAFPNSVNEKSFPDVFIQPGETYKHTTVYKFYTK